MNQAINSSAYEYIQSIISRNMKIIDIEVVGKWLRATIAPKIPFQASGMTFSVINKNHEREY